jgi:capsular polysaccharide transport system permease protein
MTEPEIKFMGPAPTRLGARSGTPRKSLLKSVPLPFLLAVVLPTLVVGIYFFFIASPRYVSEARFIVRAANQQQPSSLGVALQGVGISTAQTDAFAVHEYVSSREGVGDLAGRFDIRRVLGRPGVDFLSRYPRPWEHDTNEGLYKAFQRFVVVGYDSTTGISTLRVEAFTGKEARDLNAALLVGGEELVNALNERSSTAAVNDATAARERATANLALAQQQLTAFRNRENFLDPQLAASESSELIGGLLAVVARLRAERAQLVAEAPNSPQLPTLNNRISAYEDQIAQERQKLVGNSNSLAEKVGVYENLSLQRELADKELAQASASLITAEQESLRQKLYLERIVPPSLPDEALMPRRAIATLTVFISLLLAYGIGWLIWAGIREHRQK